MRRMRWQEVNQTVLPGSDEYAETVFNARKDARVGGRNDSGTEWLLNDVRRVYWPQLQRTDRSAEGCMQGQVRRMRRKEVKPLV